MDLICKSMVFSCSRAYNSYFKGEYVCQGIEDNNVLVTCTMEGSYKLKTFKWISVDNFRKRILEGTITIISHPIPQNRDNLCKMLLSKDKDSRLLAIGIIEEYEGGVLC